ncbi:unnamed protein product [Mytilus coruscus]|uniref:Peptidase A2 domain-containing protein n=1 Tax=Mytilus coruscus TaxID=42192 RepID=A0A6J8AR50_MYTCO|nr:unnamed protein product [Mytilus coruscus]
MRDATLLIDTGAVVSLVNKTMVPDIELLNIKPNYKHIVSATGQPFNITGIIECEVSVNSDVSVHNMYVVEDLLYDAIIGTDIMKRLGIVIDMKDEAAYWNNMYDTNIGTFEEIDEFSDEEPLPEDPYTTYSTILHSDVSDNEILIDEEEHLLVEDNANKSEDKEDNTGDDIISISDTLTFGDMNSSSHVIIEETIITIIID